MAAYTLERLAAPSSTDCSIAGNLLVKVDFGREIVRILCTDPIDPRMRPMPPPGASSYLRALQDLLGKARDHVEIICPFVDDAGIRLLEEAHEGSTGTAVWELVTRSASAKLRATSKRRKWMLWEYERPEAKLKRGFHCKMFLADSEKAILGSVNLIYANLVENAEVGVYVDDQREVRVLLDIANAIRKTCRNVA